MAAREPIPVIVFACNRAAYLRRALDAVFRHDDETGRRIIVSQDGGDRAVARVVRERRGAVEHMRHVLPWHVVARMRLGRYRGLTRHQASTQMGYIRVAQHYGWAFRRLFDGMGLERVIVLEDDIEIAADFFSLIRAGAALMARDPTVWTVSAWNDNSYPGLVQDPERLFRTEFFPGLGWLMTRQLWTEVRDRWPTINWDDWLRRPGIRKGRSVVCPEISRTYNFGREGTSGSDFFDRRLASIQVNETPVDFEAMDLEGLMHDRFDREFAERIHAARLVDEDMRADDGTSDVKMIYHGEASFDAFADRFGLMPGFRDARTPRGAYRGVVSFRNNGRFIHLVPLDYLARPQE